MELEFPWVNLPLGSTKFLLIYVDRKSLCLSADSKSIKTRYCEIKIKTEFSLWVWPSKTHMWRPFWEWMLWIRLCFALYISAQHIREAQEDFQQTPWHPGMAQADQHPAPWDRDMYIPRYTSRRATYVHSFTEEKSWSSSPASRNRRSLFDEKGNDW